MLDHEIEQTVHATDAWREQTRVLHAEWTLLNDPERLQALADQFLNLKTVAPGQFTSMAELDNRLPAVRPPDPVAPPPAPQQVPVAQSPEITQPEEPQPPPVAAAIPTSPKPASVVASVAAITPPVHIAERKAPPPRPQIAEIPSPRPPPFVPRAVAAAEPPRPMPPRIVPAASPVPQPIPPFPGSALGMAHNGALAPPRPMPVSASQWVTNGGGG